MNNIVSSSTDTILTNVAEYEYIQTDKLNNLLIDNSKEGLVLSSSVEHILVETNVSNVITVGSAGPRGLPGIVEEDIMYSKRLDTVSDFLLYRAEALVGSLESASVWRIRKIIITAEGDISELWAEGSADFNKSWLNRESYTYY